MSKPYRNASGELVKKCPVCGLEKPATQEYFHVRRSSKDGLVSACKSCVCERQRPKSSSYRRTHRASINAWCRQRYATDAEYREYRRLHGLECYYSSSEGLVVRRGPQQKKSTRKNQGTAVETAPTEEERNDGSKTDA